MVPQLPEKSFFTGKILQIYNKKNWEDIILENYFTIYFRFFKTDFFFSVLLKRTLGDRMYEKVYVNYKSV